MCFRYCGLVHALGPGPDTGAFSALVELGASLAGRKVFTIFLQVVPDFEKTTLQAGGGSTRGGGRTQPGYLLSYVVWKLTEC